jgi:acetoin:2,6-dichlorophenolindophenol oxidoreductase subunit beta
MSPRLRYIEALARALRDEMAADPRVFVLGEDVRQSLRRVTYKLVDEFGPERVIDTPLSEQAITGFATGAALCGWRPVVEYQIPTLLYVAFDQVVNQAQKLSLMTGGQARVPVTYVIPGSGARLGLAGQHSDHPYAILAQAGVKTVVPATPADAYGLLRSAIRDDDPVAVFAPAAVLGVREELPDHPEAIPIGCGRIHREGTDVTLVAVGHLVHDALAIATELSPEVSVEVLDPRTIHPFDWGLLADSVAKTGRLVVVDDTNRTCGLAGEVLATIAESQTLRARPRRVTRADVPVPFAPVLERAVLPSRDDIKQALLQVMGAG